MDEKEIKSNRAWREECESLRARVAELKASQKTWNEYYRRQHHPRCDLLEAAGTDSLGNKCTCQQCIKEDVLTALKVSQDEPVAELENHSKSALVRFAECKGYDENNPIERLRFYCSLAMTGRDWLDVEQFFDALKASQDKPVGIAGSMPGTSGFTIAAFQSDLVPIGTKLYTSAPTIPEGWKLVPIEPTSEMLWAGVEAYSTSWDIYTSMLAAAPEYKRRNDDGNM